MRRPYSPTGEARPQLLNPEKISRDSPLEYGRFWIYPQFVRVSFLNELKLAGPLVVILFQVGFSAGNSAPDLDQPIVLLLT